MSVKLYGLNGISLDLLTNLGNVRTKSSTDKFKEDLRALLETQKGTLIGDPAFGSNLYQLLFEPANESTAALIRQEVANTIEKYYSNINITQIDVKYKTNTVQLLIYYSVINTNIGDTIMLEFIRGTSI